MLTRREAFRTLGAGAALGAIGGAAILASCQTAEAAHDPFLDLLTRYREQMAIFNATEHPDDDAANAHADETFNPLYDELRDNTPVITTEKGALEALRAIIEERFHRDPFDEAMTLAALAYFDNRT